MSQLASRSTMTMKCICSDACG